MTAQIYNAYSPHRTKKFATFAIIKFNDD